MWSKTNDTRKDNGKTSSKKLEIISKVYKNGGTKIAKAYTILLSTLHIHLKNHDTATRWRTYKKNSKPKDLNMGIQDKLLEWFCHAREYFCPS
jgi:hypothetical protein